MLVLAFTVGLFLTKCLMRHIVVDAEDTLSCVGHLVPKRLGYVLAALVDAQVGKVGSGSVFQSIRLSPPSCHK